MVQKNIISSVIPEMFLAKLSEGLIDDCFVWIWTSQSLKVMGMTCNCINNKLKYTFNF